MWLWEGEIWKLRCFNIGGFTCFLYLFWEWKNALVLFFTLFPCLPESLNFARITKKHYNHQNQSGSKVLLVAFMWFSSDVHSLMCPQMVCKQNFHFSLNVTYLKSLVLSQIGIFISGTETMICHLKLNDFINHINILPNIC